MCLLGAKAPSNGPLCVRLVLVCPCVCWVSIAPLVLYVCFCFALGPLRARFANDSLSVHLASISFLVACVSTQCPFCHRFPVQFGVRCARVCFASVPCVSVLPFVSPLPCVSILPSWCFQSLVPCLGIVFVVPPLRVHLISIFPLFPRRGRLAPVSALVPRLSVRCPLHRWSPTCPVRPWYPACLFGVHFGVPCVSVGCRGLLFTC